MYKKQLSGLPLLLLLMLSCMATPQHGSQPNRPILLGAAQQAAYLPLLQGKKVALVVNPASCVGARHLVDVLLDQGIAVKKVFAPEHGFRGDSGAGELIGDAVDSATGVPIISLYGAVRKPTQDMLEEVDIVVFDLQDVGVRCYTYLSTLHDVMEACAAHQCPLIVLDRPNPNGHYVDGPVLDLAFQSFVGKHPIPVVHGMTLGEMACMINGEGWLQDQLRCALTVIAVKYYTHQTPYSLPIPPSPNLTNDQAVALYPCLSFFEGTTISTGRGTPFPFQVLGYPAPSFGAFQFTPIGLHGKAQCPKHQDQQCFGMDLRNTQRSHCLDLQYLLHFFRLATVQGVSFFGPTFDMHAGSTLLRQQMEAGCSEEEIRASWQKGLKVYGDMRKKYLLYD
jgi:uncharacterized protein YbbC (DUF1343 family)